MAASLFVDCGDSVVVQLDMSDAADVGRTTAAVECGGGSLGIELLGAAFSLPKTVQFRLDCEKNGTYKTAACKSVNIKGGHNNSVVTTN